MKKRDKADKKQDNMPPHDKMHPKAPSGILGHRQSAQLVLQYIV